MGKAILTLIISLTVISFINAQEIESEKVFGGYKYIQEGKPLNIHQLEEIMEPLPDAYKHIKKAKTNNTLATIVGYTGGFLIGWPVGTALAGGDPNWGLAGIGAGVLVLAIPFTSSYSKNVERAIGIYNSSLKSSAYLKRKPELKLIASGNGLGIRMVF
ncbi:hypothetical protein MATR_14240 [Marivirga tractuosa]|uniref:Uncharacterized protein n=1 Tax=Marivirga tractuosa (strain ATCC 23168 / DSM 4126 / NBRC 15989 / NCIMB 1408 / VKM B-1430 / H-43) TaxID=643867 RepID=E4TTN3_MARTH|nr:hypothetical protein [Marivirga tractuosa]ADR20950.1 hypothetical protein Ftrac_0948 [Marivirga tractuosa DSM 4126]BDD14599.1 hypothetical protein MATR_14240 [Marivirga tractuosa]